MTDPELLAYSSEHLLHELSMLWELAAVLPGRPAGAEADALLESFALHLRNLIEFFFFLKKKDEYVRAQHFFEHSSELKIEVPLDVRKLLERVNTEVSHLTDKRIDGNAKEKEWKTSEMVELVERETKKFAARASPKKLHPKVQEFLNQPAKEKLAWIVANVTHTNVASSSMSDLQTASLPDYGNVSTHTALIPDSPTAAEGPQKAR
jgi:hypothetical protein